MMQTYHRKVNSNNLLEHLPMRVKQTRRAHVTRYAIGLGASILGIAGGIMVSPYLLAASAIGIGIVGEREAHIRSHNIEIHENKIACNHGLLSRRTYSIYYDDIVDTKMVQTVWQRLMGYGSVYVNNPSYNAHQFFQHRMPRPDKMRLFIEHMEHRYAITRHKKEPITSLHK